MKRLSDVTSYLFEDHIIISLSKDWLNTFGKLPDFEVLIDNLGKLHLKSKQTIHNRGVKNNVVE